MTENTKENIIKYLTNNKENENYSQDLVYSSKTSVKTDLYDTIRTQLLSISVIDYVLGKNINGNTLNYSIIYGNYPKNSNVYNRGFIAIIDEVGNLIQLITQYNSNVDIGYIYSMNVDENGNFFMIERNVINNSRRFVMLNNIVVKRQQEENYYVDIRKSYNIPTSSIFHNFLTGFKLNIIKAVGQSKYAFFYSLSETYHSQNYIKPSVTELIINVGAENEWNDWEGSIYNINNLYCDTSPICSYATWEQEQINFVYLTSIWPPGDNSKLKKVAKYYNNNNNEIVYTTINVFPNMIEGDNDYYEDYISGTILNNQDAYVSMTRQDTSQGIEQHGIQKINLINNTATWEKIEQGYINDETRYYLTSIDEEVFFLNIVCYEKTNDGSKYHIYVGRLRDDVEYYDNIYSQSLLFDTTAMYIGSNTIFLFYVNKQFNLYNINLIWNNYTYNKYQIYNRNNYNGTSFDNIKSLYPNSAVFYNENNKPIFARNLYNKIINNGTTVSVVEVPYNYINDITIAKQDLLSYNNNVMVDKLQNIVTNQYEELNVNFINTISISNHNDEDRPILNKIGATRLNGSISDTLDYTNATLNKIKLIYEDDTSYIKEINPATQISQFVYKYTFNVYNPSSNAVKEIQLISHDENTIYQTIDFTNQASGKTYKISQNVEIQ